MGFTPEIPTRLSDNNHIISLRFSVRSPARLGDKVLCLFPFKNVVNVRPALQVLRQARKQEPRDLPRHVWLLAGYLGTLVIAGLDGSSLGELSWCVYGITFTPEV